MSQTLSEFLGSSGVRDTAPSIGIPVLMPDGKTILRGPRINVPEIRGYETTVPLDDAGKLETWIHKGWIDLRPENVARWQERFRRMRMGRAMLRDAGSAAATIHVFMGDRFEIGEVVAWIFNNELNGYRIK